MVKNGNFFQWLSWFKWYYNDDREFWDHAVSSLPLNFHGVLSPLLPPSTLSAIFNHLSATLSLLPEQVPSSPP